MNLKPELLSSEMGSIWRRELFVLRGEQAKDEKGLLCGCMVWRFTKGLLFKKKMNGELLYSAFPGVLECLHRTPESEGVVQARRWGLGVRGPLWVFPGRRAPAGQNGVQGAACCASWAGTSGHRDPWGPDLPISQAVAGPRKRIPLSPVG